jgi:hypothetical protein
VRVNEPEFVAFDTGIYVAGILRRLPPERHLASQIVELAREGLFCLVILRGVVREYLQVAARGGEYDRGRNAFDEFLSECGIEPYVEPALDPALIRAEQAPYTARLRHEHDAPIAVELARCRPDYFVHSNSEHWGPGLNELLGTRVVTCREYLQAHGIRPHPLNR